MRKATSVSKRTRRRRRSQQPKPSPLRSHVLQPEQVANLQAEYRRMWANNPKYRSRKHACAELRARLGFEVNDATLKRQIIFPVEAAISAEGGGMIINGGTF
jgi:hypothetical protein